MNLKSFKNMDVIDSEGCDIVKKLQIEFKDHDNLSNRLKKTLYYGKIPKNQRSSLPLTEVAVELFANSNKGKLDIVGVDFASSFSRQACVSPCSLMLALVYLENLKKKNPDYLQTVSSCDLFLVSMLVASKYLFDDGEEEEVFNDEWAAASAHLDTKDLNKLERNFLAAMNWEIFVKPQTFYEMLTDMEYRIAHWEGCKRGWLTYTDVYVLTQKEWLLSHYWNIVQDIFKVVVVSVIAYVSAIATLVTAASVSHHCTEILTSQTASYFFPPSSNLSPPLSIKTALPQSTDQIYYYDRQWHSVLTSHLNLDYNYDTKPVNKSCDGREGETNYPVMDCVEEKASIFNWNIFWLWSKEEIAFAEPDLTADRKFSIWNSFQYWPTCCGGVGNSYVL